MLISLAVHLLQFIENQSVSDLCRLGLACNKFSKDEKSLTTGVYFFASKSLKTKKIKKFQLQRASPFCEQFAFHLYLL